MSTAVLRKTQANSNGVPLTQNTAPVIEFRCLYTHDVRRKSKRWQDGFLKFHTFNNRVMVYDVPRNFIGDTHWKDQDELQEGDEISLECAVLVQVNEPIERSETDLTPLFEKRDKSSAKRLVGVQDKSRQSEFSHKTRTAAQSQNRHKSLQALLGDSRGPHGKAVLHAQSPYEIRSSDAENDWPDRPSSKRRKVDALTETKDLVQTTGTAKKRAESSESRRTKGGQKDESSHLQSRPVESAASCERSGPNLRSVIDISSDREHPSSDGLAPGPTMPPPPRSHKKTQQRGLRRPAPSRQKDRSTASKVLNGDFEIDTTARPSSPPVSTTNQMSSTQESPAPSKPVCPNEDDLNYERPAGRPFRFSKKASRNMLICQDISKKRPASKAAETTSIDEENGRPLARKQSTRRKDCSAQVPPVRKTDRECLQERVAQIGKKSCYQSAESSSPAIPPYDTVNPATPPAAKTSISSSFPFPCTDDNTAITLAQLDQQLLVAAPAPANSPSRAPEPALDRDRDHNHLRGAQSRTDNSTDLGLGHKKPTVSTENLEQARQRAEVEGAVLRQPFRKAKAFPGGVVERAGEKGGGKSEGGEQSTTRSKDNDSGPWSREAEDLFDWRPPDWDERGKRGEVLVNG
ncbi:MAG: hypothetical protein Q9157_008505 [Trypethelium eluteriae]